MNRDGGEGEGRKRREEVWRNWQGNGVVREKEGKGERKGKRR